MNFNIREGLYEDLPAISHITVLGWQQTYRGLICDEYLDSMDEEMILETNQKLYFNNVLVLEEGGKIIGFIKYGKSDEEEDKGQIYALYILEGYKGYGYGKKLLFKAFDKLKEQGYNNIILGCLVGNPSNGFYEHLGGECIGTKKSTFNNITLEENIYLFKL